MDFSIPVGTPIYAADSGNVMFADWATTLSASNPWWIAPAYAGICVVINHNDGFLTLYAHLNETSLNNGQFVEKGQLIGLSGTTGLSTGPHLHFEVIGWPLQPYNGFYGRLNPGQHVSGYAKSVPLASNQRKVGANNLNQRAEPNTTATVVRTIQANTVETFDGYVVGEMFAGHDVWYKDAEGYVWSGAFEDSSVNGLKNLTPPPPAPVLAANQRRVSAVSAYYRKTPKLNGELIDTFKKGDILNLSAWTTSDEFAGQNKWFKGALTDGWVWAGALEDQSTNGLVEVKQAVPAPPAPTPVPEQPKTVERTVVDVGVRVRTLPYLTATVKEVLPANTKVTVKSFVNSDKALDTYVWYALENGYAHASGFTDQTTTGLTESAKPAAPVVTEPESNNPSNLGYSFTPDFDFVEYRPAHYDNMGDGNFPANPAMIVLHQFDAKDKFPSLDGVINFFQTGRPAAPSSAHFGVSGDRIVQFVSLKDRAFHAREVGNNYIGIEVDPQEDEKTIASVKKLISALNKKYGKVFTYIKHQNVAGNSTKCGDDIHLEKYLVDAVTPPVVVDPPVIVVPPIVVEPEPEPTPIPEPAPEKDEEYEALVDDLLDSLKKVLIHLNK
jgi:hypothetical protein